MAINRLQNYHWSDKWKERTVIFHSTSSTEINYKQQALKNSYKQGCSAFVFMKIKSNFNFAFVLHERPLQRLSVKNTHTFYSLPLYPNNRCKYLCSMSKLTQRSLNAKIRNVYAKKNIFFGSLCKRREFQNVNKMGGSNGNS